MKQQTARNSYVPLIIFIILLIGLMFAFNYGIERSFQSQDRMLCNSAKTSQNFEYLQRCACYYDTGDINCLKTK